MSTQTPERNHLVVDYSTPRQPGVRLHTDRCFCGAVRGVDYERYPLHLEEHEPEDLGLTRGTAPSGGEYGE